jgi:hypothetical protein
LATVIASRLSSNEIAEKIDPRISSMLNGMAGMLPLTGPDYRLFERKKGENKSG